LASFRLSVDNHDNVYQPPNAEPRRSAVSRHRALCSRGKPVYRRAGPGIWTAAGRPASPCYRRPAPTPAVRVSTAAWTRPRAFGDFFATLRAIHLPLPSVPILKPVGRQSTPGRAFSEPHVRRDTAPLRMPGARARHRSRASPIPHEGRCTVARPVNRR